MPHTARSKTARLPARDDVQSLPLQGSVGRLPINVRPDLGRHLRQRVEAFREGFRHNLALIGPPGSGKTFQLHRLLAERPPGLTFIYCPLYRESCRSFLHRLLCAMLQASLPAVDPIADTHAPDGSPNQTLTTLLERARAVLPKTAAAINAIGPLLERRLYSEAFCRALDTIPLVIEERQQPCVLILDEFLFLEDLGFVHAFHELGKRVMTWNAALFILSSSSPCRARAILRERLQLLFGQFELLTCEAPDIASATSWVQQELKGLRRATVLSPFLIQWLGAYPWYLALFLKRLHEVAAIRRMPEVSDTLFFHAAWDLVGSAEGALHQWCGSRTERLAHVRHGPRAMEALIQIAAGARTTTEIGKRIGRGGLTQALQLLVEYDLAQRNGMCWMVPDPILRCWLSTVVSAQRADSFTNSADSSQRCERYLRTLWTQWVEAHELSFSEQVVRLFSQFRDDTVSLDSKTGRLPTFETIRTQATGGALDHNVYVVADGEGKRWCASVQEGAMDESAIARFETFCRSQSPKPARKVVVTKGGMDENARLLAKSANMWVWEPEALSILAGVYGQL